MTASFKDVLREVFALLGNIETIFNVVSKLKDHSDDLVTDLTDALDDADASIQAAAAFSLCHLFYVFWPEEIDASSSITKLLTLIDDDDPRVRFETTRAVAVLQVGRNCPLTDEQIVVVYICCLESGDARLRIDVAGQLGAMGPAAIAALPALSRLLDDENPGDRVAARNSAEEIRMSQCRFPEIK
jgi:HEAT repeat protein